MKVWIVTTGRYSDYTIEGIFSTKELADTFLKEEESSRWPKVVECEVDERAGHCKRTVYMYRLPDHGTSTYEEIESPTARVAGSQNSRMNRPSRDIQGRWHAVGRSLVDHEHAKKLAEEAVQEEIRKQALESPDAHHS